MKVDLTGDEVSIIDTLIAGEIRRQNEMIKLDMNKRNPDHAAAVGSTTVINRLRALREKLQ